MIIPLLRSISDFLEPWKTLYSDSLALSTGVTAVHVTALLFGGGFAVAADRTTLQITRGDMDARNRQLHQLHAVHRPVLIALTSLFVSGILMMTADFDEFIESPVFWIKMGLIALLLLNGARLVSLESRLRGTARAEITTQDTDSLWQRLRSGAWLSITLWTATLVVGVVLVNTA